MWWPCTNNINSSQHEGGPLKQGRSYSLHARWCAVQAAEGCPPPSVPDVRLLLPRLRPPEAASVWHCQSPRQCRQTRLPWTECHRPAWQRDSDSNAVRTDVASGQAQTHTRRAATWLATARGIACLRHNHHLAARQACWVLLQRAQQAGNHTLAGIRTAACVHCLQYPATTVSIQHSAPPPSGPCSIPPPRPRWRGTCAAGCAPCPRCHRCAAPAAWTGGGRGAKEAECGGPHHQGQHGQQGTGTRPTEDKGQL